jgi:hypothetical protein
MAADLADMVQRLKSALPTRWFADATPVLDGVLNGLAATAVWLHDMLDVVRRQARVATASGAMLDMICVDFFGSRIRRGSGQNDAALRAVIQRELLRGRATRVALVNVLTDMTGRAPDIFEPLRPAGVGGYGGVLGYGVAGRWASLAMPLQCLVVAYRPVDAAYLPLEDAEIQGAIAGVMPVTGIAWTRIDG